MTKINLCDTCKNSFPECPADEVLFGCDIEGGDPTADNVVECDAYEKEDKA